MKTIPLVNASPLGSASRAYAIARKAADKLLDSGANTRLIERDLSPAHPSPIAKDYADAVAKRAERDAPAFAQSEILIQEVIDCDYLIIATPMHNFTAPASLKLWIDYVLRVNRTFTHRDGYKIGLLADRPTLVVVGSGGVYHGAHARQPDYLSSYFALILATIGINNVQFIHLQGLVRPDMAEQSRILAERQLAVHPVFGLVSAATGS
ncbi:NAD(P)H-dependent oxidoreductase [Rhizobium calliandrae]|uniref:FMN dependent NADH:quinone oxidoreductase n=1 Tax=Rhizobium calliandrae TaxID=1312182 RepID=A0ABT7KJJ6_9HYPH|nr:NAD(P)H-dependent oxidoreductase [Rhizobium calliandrae]MDL2407423.1 NAD(P)H-dependent oxidoreductase [Rhizobium calliandrae]